MAELREQKHPRETKDRLIVDRLLTEDATDANLLDLARLRIRYCNFPGARDIQRDLDLLLQKFQLTEEELFRKTREIYASGKGYQPRRDNQAEDWS